MFRHRCSYLIHSAAWDALPREALDWLYARLRAVLWAERADDEFARLDLAERRAIREILLATKPTLPPDWRR
jgi:hypothetical protein